jgi:DNA-binding transcriptional regulator of glucitol operon
MIIELKRWHWALFIALLLTQFFGMWTSLEWSHYGLAFADFFRRIGWLGLWIPAFYLFSSAFGTTVILAKLSEVVTEHKS